VTPAGRSCIALFNKGAKDAKKGIEKQKKRFDLGQKVYGFYDASYKDLGKKTYEHWVSQYGAIVDKYLGHANSVTAIILAARTDQKTPNVGKSGWDPGKGTKWWEKAQTWAERVATIYAIGKDLKETWAPEQKKTAEKAKKPPPESLENRECDAEHLQAVKALAAPPCMRDHACLHRAEQQQRPGRGRQADVRERERCRIGEQRKRRSPVAAKPFPAVAQPQQQPEHRGAGRQPDAGECRGPDGLRRQRQAAQHGVGGEADQRERRQHEQADGRHGASDCLAWRRRAGGSRS